MLLNIVQLVKQTEYNMKYLLHKFHAHVYRYLFHIMYVGQKNKTKPVMFKSRTDIEKDCHCNVRHIERFLSKMSKKVQNARNIKISSISQTNECMYYMRIQNGNAS